MRHFLKYWLPLLIWLVVIFVGSTDLLSAEHTSRFIVPMLLWLKPAMSPQAIRSVTFAIRKCAHVCEYAILALLLWRALRSHPILHMKISTLVGIVFVGCALFAASDEFHQSFVTSRTASVRDVLVDISGAVLGLVAAASCLFLRGKKPRPVGETELVGAGL